MALKIKKNKSETPPESCPLTKCMSILGGAWTPNLVWYLSGGPRRFSELKIDVPGISAKVLTARLRELESNGVVLREVKPSSPPSVEYSLTRLGLELVPAINAIVSVGHRLKQMQSRPTSSHIKPKTKKVPQLEPLS
jgi:DNA-binding HxlR family transcriptional regulator